MEFTPEQTEDLSADREKGLLALFDSKAWQADPTAEVTPLRRGRPAPTELWLRSPHLYPAVLGETPYHRFAFAGPDLKRRRKSAREVLAPMLPAGLDYRALVINTDHALIVHRDPDVPDERVPVWFPSHDPARLLRLCRAAEAQRWSRIVVGFPFRGRPTRDQSARIVDWLYRVGASYPDVPLHLTNSGSFRWLFGLDFLSADYAPANAVSIGMVTLPNGLTVNTIEMRRHLKWLHVLGYSASSLTDDPMNRTRFNIASALWAAENWNDPRGLKPLAEREREDPHGLLAGKVSNARRNAARPRTTLQDRFDRPPLDPDDYPQYSPDPAEPYSYVEPVTNLPLVPVKPRRLDSGDKILCNACSLAPTCRAFREGSVCTVADSPMKRLSDMFGTRDAAIVKDALGEVVAAQADRYARTANAWREDGESDIHDIRKSEHLMKMENSLTRSGEALVKILDPSYRDSAVPAISAGVMHVYNPRVLVADVVKALEAQGVDRASIDPAKVIEVAREQGAIE